MGIITMIINDGTRTVRLTIKEARPLRIDDIQAEFEPRIPYSDQAIHNVCELATNAAGLLELMPNA